MKRNDWLSRCLKSTGLLALALVLFAPASASAEETAAAPAAVLEQEIFAPDGAAGTPEPLLLVTPCTVLDGNGCTYLWNPQTLCCRPQGKPTCRMICL